MVGHLILDLKPFLFNKNAGGLEFNNLYTTLKSGAH